MVFYWTILRLDHIYLELFLIWTKSTRNDCCTTLPYEAINYDVTLNLSNTIWIVRKRGKIYSHKINRKFTFFLQKKTTSWLRKLNKIKTKTIPLWKSPALTCSLCVHCQDVIFRKCC